ncbi:MAG: helix-turn-helix domain-containing protein [Streptosporangiaceae bacterium]
MKSETSSDARSRLLLAAERLLREQGYDVVSVRAVNKAAGMNPAAVHYHFGSKPDLVTALLESRLRGRWEDRLTVLDDLSQATDPPSVNDLAAILVEPMARLAVDPDTRWLLGLLARLVLAGHPLPWRSPWSAPEPWVELISRAHPGLTTHQAAGRWQMARDLVLLTYGTPFAEFTEPGTAPSPPAAGTVVAFVAAGLGAPA